MDLMALGIKALLMSLHRHILGRITVIRRRWDMRDMRDCFSLLLHLYLVYIYMTYDCRHSGWIILGVRGISGT